jgi:hypothetical protein
MPPPVRHWGTRQGTLPAPAVVAPGTTFNPAIASNGNGSLVAWRATDNILARQLDGAGAPIGTAAFTISDATGVQNRPAIASDGADYLVVWEDGSTSARSYRCN